MSKRWIAVLALVVVVAAGLFGAWWFVLRSDAPPSASVGGGGACAGTPGGSVDGSWKVVQSDAVFLGYRIEELFGGDTVKKTAAGRTPAVTGTMTISGPQVTAVEVTADVTKLRSDQARRDNFIKGQALETDKIGQATFKLTQPIALSSQPSGCDQVQATAKGDLTLHGVTKPVEIPITARRNSANIEVSGNTAVALADYGIIPPDIGFVKVDPNGRMELQLAFAKS